MMLSRDWRSAGSARRDPDRRFLRMVPKPPSASACADKPALRAAREAARSSAARYPSRPDRAMCERRKVPVPRAHSSPSQSTIRASATNTRRLPEIQRPSARASPVAHRLGEVEVEGGGQQEAVADQAVGGIESGVVEHLEIERAMRRAGGVESYRATTVKRISLRPASGSVKLRFEQPVDRRRVVERLERPQMRFLSASAAASGGIAFLGAHQHRGHRIAAAGAAQLLDDRRHGGPGG